MTNEEYYLDSLEDVVNNCVKPSADFEKEILLDVLRIRSKSVIMTVMNSMKSDNKLQDGAIKRVEQYLTHQKPHLRRQEE